ncbi:MAG: hypothetical protein GX587_11035 [Bacteroidales bacterium]|nr:hypothetical protein [Bacteroidales bacterium]
MKKYSTLIYCVVINSFILAFVLWVYPNKLFTTVPEENWWTALSIITTISFGVIAVGITIIFRERSQKEQIDNLVERIAKNENENLRINEIISGIIEVQNATENQSEKVWNDLLGKINKLDNKSIISPFTLRTWSTIAWKQGHLKYTILLREKALSLDENDFRSRIMLCSALTYEKTVDKKRIEYLLDKTNQMDSINSNDNFEHYNNIRGLFHLRVGEYKEAQSCFLNNCEITQQTWPFKGVIVSMLFDKSISNEEIKNKIEPFDKTSKWYDDSIIDTRPLRLMISAIIDKTKSTEFYSIFTPKNIAEIIKKYDSDFVKSKFFNGYEIIQSKYNDYEIDLLYLTYYYFFGAFDEKADKEINKTHVIEKINKMIKNAL